MSSRHVPPDNMLYDSAHGESLVGKFKEDVIQRNGQVETARFAMVETKRNKAAIGVELRYSSIGVSSLNKPMRLRIQNPLRSLNPHA